MSTPVLILLTVVSVLALVSFVRLHIWLVGRYLHEEERCDEVHFTTTSDGWRLALMRYRPSGRLSGGAPILLCPGLCENHRVFDLTKEVGFARFLAARGHDVFVANLRATGRSITLCALGIRRRRASFDDYALRDAPALVDAVKRATGAPSVIWVGHSLGGMVGLAHAGAAAPSGLRAIVTLATAMAFERFSLLKMAAVPRFIPAIAVRLLGRVFAPVAPWVNVPPLNTGFHLRNMSAATLRRAVYHMTEDLSVPFLRQLRDWARTRSWRTLDGTHDYREALARVDVPVLMGIAPLDFWSQADYDALFERIGSARKTRMVLGRTEGCSIDYGHADLLLADSAPRDVYGLVAGWIESEQGIHEPLETPAPSAQRARATKARTVSPPSA